MSVATTQHCACYCHRSKLAAYRIAIDADDFATASTIAAAMEFGMPEWADVTDPLEAAVACPLCASIHTPALSGKPRPKYKPPTEWKPDDDATGAT